MTFTWLITFTFFSDIEAKFLGMVDEADGATGNVYIFCNDEADFLYTSKMYWGLKTDV